MKNKFYKHTLLRLHFSLENFSGLFTVKGGRPLINILKGMFIFADAQVTSGLMRYACSFVWTCKKIVRSQGAKGLVLMLKASGVSVQQAIGRHVIHDSAKLGCRFARTRHGLPRWIPLQIRMRIRKGDAAAIRVTLTLINVFRVITYPGTLKLKSITAPSIGHGGLDHMIKSFIPLFVKLFITERFGKEKVMTSLSKYSEASCFSMFKGGPGVQGFLGQWNTMPWILLRAYKALKQNSILWEAISIMLGSLPYTKVKFGMKVADSVVDASFQDTPLVKPLPYLGKLGTKEEAAGKIRVFAMVDGWTQWILYPFHQVIFDILRDVKMDGTFNQVRPLSFLRAVFGLWSLDLTAATDRIPVWLQRELWAKIFSAEFAGAWALLLTSRPYRLHAAGSYQDLKYAVGQPMGALSSWASLAITHHFVVQVAAWRAGHPRSRLYTNYAILGDDIVIGDHKVMVQYLAILSSLGVECGLHKSLLSRDGSALEFAKRTLYKGVDVSPVPIREFYAASKGIGAWVAMVEKYHVSFPKALQAFGVGWRVRSWLNKPLGKLPARVRLLILAINVPRDEEAVNRFFELGKAPVMNFVNDTKIVIEEFVSKEVKRLITKEMLFSNTVVGFNADSWAKEQVIALRDTFKVSKFGYVGRLLADALTNLANLTWHEGKVLAVGDAGRIIKQLHDLPKSNFAALYLQFLEISREVSSQSLHTFSTTRPNPLPEVKGILNPSQVRLWKRWSGILQGSQAVKGGNPL